MAPKPVFVALGDIHLTNYIWTRHRSITGDAPLGFKAFIDHGIRLHVPIVIVGDLFDSIEPDSSDVELFRTEMDRCRDAKVAVYAIQGNHDKRATPWYTAIHSHVLHVGDGTPFQLGPFQCQAFDYAPKDTISASIAKIVPKTTIVFLHQYCRQYMPISKSWNFDLDLISVPLIIMGDIHAHWSCQTKSGFAYYTGASHARDITQGGPKRCLMVDEELGVHPLLLPSRSIERHTFLTKQAITDFAAIYRAPESPLQPVCQLSYTLDLVEDVVALKRLLSQLGVHTLDDPIADGYTEQVNIDTLDVPTPQELLARILAEPALGLGIELLDPLADASQTIRSARERFIARLA